jgi:hypothetical protein
VEPTIRRTGAHALGIDMTTFFTRSSGFLRWTRVFGCLYLAIAASRILSTTLFAQAKPTASRVGDLQVGAIYNLTHPDYGPNTLRGFWAYATFDFGVHWGIEAAFHQWDDPDSKEGIYEGTFEVGPRYVLHFGPLQPYGKFVLGRGVFQFPPDPRHPANGSVANLAYTMCAGGFGVDYHLTRSINVRADYELQRWGRSHQMD